MTPDDIAQIRTMRGFNVSWHIIARRLGKTVQECRASINMPEFAAPTERQALPWDTPTIRQQQLPFK